MRLILSSMTLLVLAGAMAVDAQAPKQAPEPAKLEDPYGRFLGFQGVTNFRDMGGYRTRDGRHVRRGVLYRSAAMSGLSPVDDAWLGRLGIKSVTDLRYSGERETAPVIQKGKFGYWTGSDVEMWGLSTTTTGARTPEVMRAAMIDMYRKMPWALKGAYEHIFQQLVAGRVPLAFICTDGKDRAGMAAALILTALGVPRETVLQDYLLSNAVNVRRALLSGKAAILLSPQNSAPTAIADKAYFDAFFETLDQHSGSVEAYLRIELGVGPAELRKMRALLLV